MDNSELEQNLLPKKGDPKTSEKYDDDIDNDEIFESWNHRNKSYFVRFRDGLRDSVHSQGQRLLLVISAVTNLVFLIIILKDRYQNQCYNESPIVGLVPNAFKRTMSIHTPYATPHENNTARDKLWEDIGIDRGLVAVDEKIVAEHGLPETIAFPWDSTKRVYIVNAFHQLHCLKLIYSSLTAVHNGGPLMQYEHLVHCLDQLRQDVHCRADDNLYYIGDINAGHVRQCRDFSKLDEWALEHHACYSFEKPPIAGVIDVEAFANCRESSSYLQTMKDHFGYGDDYQPKYPPHEGPTFHSW